MDALYQRNENPTTAAERLAIAASMLDPIHEKPDDFKIFLELKQQLIQTELKAI